MEIPRFKPSNKFADEMNIPCLVAKLKNSAVAGIGAKYRKEIGEDPAFQIYLRGAKPKEVSVWQQQVLDRLFRDGELVRAITEGMKAYEESTGYEDSEEIQHDGILPHLYLTRIVIDDRWQEVIIGAHTLADGNLDEHGIAIHLKDGRWAFGALDYLSDYLRKVDTEDGEPSGDSEPELTIRNLIGTWILDEDETSKRMIKRGLQSYLKSTLKDHQGLYWEITEDKVRSNVGGFPHEGQILKCEWHDREANLTYQVTGNAYPGSFGGKLQKNGKLGGDTEVYRRLASGESLPASEWKEMDPTPLFGVWENDTKVSGINMTFVVEITRERVFQTTKVMGKTKVMEFAWTRSETNGKSIRLDSRFVLPDGNAGGPYPLVIQMNSDQLRWQSQWTLRRKRIAET